MILYEKEAIDLARGGYMTARDRVHNLIGQISTEVLGYIRKKEASCQDRWVPAADIKSDLELNFIAVPRENKQYGEKGWFFAIIARLLEDQGLVQYKKIGNRAYYRSIPSEGVE